MEQEKGGNKGRRGENEERDSRRERKNGCQYVFLHGRYAERKLISH